MKKDPVRRIGHFLKAGISDIVFPNVCICCGMEITEEEKQICPFCLTERFEDANPENRISSGDVILPEGVLVQHALWKFDKGGSLQNLLHQLKYERLTKIGVQLGSQLAYRSLQHTYLEDLLSGEILLVPVPLHYLRYIRRGYNQAYLIARGVQSVLESPICNIKSVVRRKNTRTQTGFSLEKRRLNVEKAFKVNDVELVKNRLIVIVDDVFTTGATTFELSGVLLRAGASGVIILTIAQA